VPVSFVNNGTPGITYTEAFTVVFNPPRSGFSLNTANGGIYYQLATPGPGAAVLDVVWESFEHFLLPGMQRFDSTDGEGMPWARQFAGIRMRSANAATPASVTVI